MFSLKKTFCLTLFGADVGLCNLHRVIYVLKVTWIIFSLGIFNILQIFWYISNFES